MLEKRKPKLLMLVNVDWFFLSHRLALALAAKEAGLDVLVAAASTGRDEEIRSFGLDFLPVPMSRKGTNPLLELISIASVIKLFKEYQPDIAHLVSIKPILYGSIASKFTKNTKTINAISGFGFVFSSSDQKAKKLKRIVLPFYKMALDAKNSKTIFQNRFDMEAAVSHGLLQKERAVLIRGSGVDSTLFQPKHLPEDQSFVIMLASRMLWDKGIKTFLEAVPLVRREFREARFVLVGEPDDGNPTSIPLDLLKEWHSSGLIEYWGPSQTMHETLCKATLVVLPSFHEGLPKVLLEAAACGKPIVASDIPGCREIVAHGTNGFLVQPKDPVQLATAICDLLRSKDKREIFGLAGRKRAETEFDLHIVVEQTLGLYRKIIAETV
jgi:glycosyltransferase involved in cell wall biosynthesis